MSRTKAIVGKEAKIKNKVCAGLEVVANDPTHLINPSSRFGGSVLSAKPTTKGARAALFLWRREVGSHTCAFSNLMSRTKAIVGKEAKIKNKVCAGLEVVANDPTLSAMFSG